MNLGEGTEPCQFCSFWVFLFWETVWNTHGGKFVRAYSVPAAGRDVCSFGWGQAQMKGTVLGAYLATDSNHVLQFSVISNKVKFLYSFPYLPHLCFNSGRLQRVIIILKPQQMQRRTNRCRRNSSCDSISVNRDCLSLGFRLFQRQENWGHQRQNKNGDSWHIASFCCRGCDLKCL